jgi:hypothetical protein
MRNYIGKIIVYNKYILLVLTKYLFKYCSNIQIVWLTYVSIESILNRIWNQTDNLPTTS